jgi:hypothetical protein
MSITGSRTFSTPCKAERVALRLSSHSNQIIPNDNQVFRVVVEKKAAPPQSHGKGHLTVRRLSSWRLVRKPKVPTMRAG